MTHWKKTNSSLSIVPERIVEFLLTRGKGGWQEYNWLVWGRILGRNSDKSLESFLLAIHIHLYSFALEIFFSPKVSQPLTVSTVQLLYTVKEKGGKPDGKPYLLPFGLRNPQRNLKSENSQDYAQKPQRNCTLMNSSDWGRASRMDIHYALGKDLFGIP